MWKKVKVKGERRKRREESDKKGTSGGYFCLIKKIPHPWEQRWSHSCHLKIECVHFMSWDTRTIYIDTTRTHPEGYFKHELYFKHDGNSSRGLSNISGETWRQAFSGDSLKIRALQLCLILILTYPTTRSSSNLHEMVIFLCWRCPFAHGKWNGWLQWQIRRQ